MWIMNLSMLNPTNAMIERFDSLTRIEREAFADGQYEVAYQALMAGLKPSENK